MCQIRRDEANELKLERANELKLEKLINDKSIDNLVETIFPKMNELKDSVNEISDRDLAVGNTPKCKKEKR